MTPDEWDDDATNDYHKSWAYKRSRPDETPVPKGPSTMSDGKPTPVMVTGASHALPSPAPANETDKERWARLKLKGYLGLKPADFDWIMEKARLSIF